MKHPNTIHVGMCGLGMIYAETYQPVFRRFQQRPIFDGQFGPVEVEVTGVVSRTGERLTGLGGQIGSPPSFAGPGGLDALLAAEKVDAVCVATPDDRHFELAKTALNAGKHVLIEKPSVLKLAELDELCAIAARNGVLAKVVYHKLFDPDHKRLRTLYQSGALKHVNNGYCSLLEPKHVSRAFAEWIGGRNPASYVAVHYLKLIDFTFGPNWKLVRVQASGQKGQLAPDTWDSVQLRVVYLHADGREAAFDIHTDWVTPDNFPGAVEQEVQFRFDNGVWNAHQRKRGVECVIEDRPDLRTTPNHHYSTEFLEPWDETSRRGYGMEAIERFFEEVAFVEFGGTKADRSQQFQQMRSLTYNDLSADRNVVAAVQACEAILAEHAAGRPGAVVEVHSDELVMHSPRQTEPIFLYSAPS